MKLLPQAAPNNPDVKLKNSLTRLASLNMSGQHERIDSVVEKSIQIADELEFELDEPNKLTVKGALLATLRTPNHLRFQSDESKRLLLRRLEIFHDDCQSTLGKSHKTTVGALLGIAVMHGDFGEYEKASHLLNDLIILYQGSPKTLAPAYQACLIERIGLALKAKETLEVIEAISQLVEIRSKTSGPFHPETIGHKLSLISTSSRKASVENSKYPSTIITRKPWEGADNAIWIPVGLALAYKFAGEVEEIDALWDGAVEHMLPEESPGVRIDDFIYAFELAAGESKRSTYQEASNIMQRQVVRVKELKEQRTRRIGLPKSKLLKLLKDFWSLVDSIGLFASPAEPRPLAIHLRRYQGLNSPSPWPEPRVSNIESAHTEERECRRQLGRRIIAKIDSSPPQAKPYMLLMCVQSLELYYNSEKTRKSAPLDTSSVDLLQGMATEQFGETHILSLRMHFVSAITSQLSNVPIRREESEACIMKHRFKDIAEPGNIISLNASSVFERLIDEYRKRGWYSLSLRLYEITFRELSTSLGWCHEETMCSLCFLLEMYWRVDGKLKLSLFLQTIDTVYQRKEPHWKEIFSVSMAGGGSFLLREGLPEPASLIFRQVLKWAETIPKEKHNAEWMAQTWMCLGKALHALGDETGARDSKIQAESLDACAS